MDNQKTKFVQLLTQFVETKTVSADPDLKGEIHTGAELAAKVLREAGFKSEIVPTNGNPVVFGSRIVSPEAPTVLVYNHLDVQPADPTNWDTNPFKLTVKGDKYFGRGATDDKGPAITAYLAATLAKDLPLNLKFVWELEEEIGSLHFEQFVKSRAAQLQTDVIIVSDTMWISADQPVIPTGLRGLVTFEATITVGVNDVHSGVVGGPARNPLLELATIIAACCDPVTGHVLIPGFYDGIDPIPDSQLKQLKVSGITAQSLKSDYGLTSIRPGSDAEVASQVMIEPTFEVHGITGGYIGPGVKTVIPPTATAKLSTRLVPGQDPTLIKQLIAEFLLSKNPDLKISFEGAARPYYADPAGFYSSTAADAVESAFGVRPVFLREGGSIGAVSTLDQYLHAPVVMIGLSLPTHGYHAPNEHFDWHQAEGGIKMFLSYFEAIAKRGQD